MYVVRVVDDVEADDDELRGILRRVSDGTEWAFHGGEQLIELLHRDPGPVPGGTGSG